MVEASSVFYSLIENERFQLKNHQVICLLRSDFHKINYFATSKDATYEIRICSKSFFFLREQLILFSISAFQFITENYHSFDLIGDFHFFEDQLISCFSEIFSLFSISSEIQISPSDVLIFQYFSEKFQNPVLFSVCQSVIDSGESHPFYLTSEIFSEIPANILNLLNNFFIQLDNETILCNDIYSTLISNKIFKHLLTDRTSNMIDFSHFQFPEIILSFFGILKGNKIEINEGNMKQMIYIIHFLEFDSYSLHSIFQNSIFNLDRINISSFLDFKIDLLQSIISFPYLHLKEENQLFEIIYQKIQENRKLLFLLDFSCFGCICSAKLNYLIQSIQIHEFNEDRFQHFQYSFFFNYLLPHEYDNQTENIQSLLIKSKEIYSYFQKEQTKSEYNLLFDSYSIFSSEILEFESSNQILLRFTQEQKNSIFQYNFIQLINGTINIFEESDFSFQNNSLLIFLPHPISKLGKGCFFGHNTLIQIHLPFSINSIGDECFFECKLLSSINIHSSITYLGSNCFSRCHSLFQIDIPFSITSLPSGCFSGCKSLSQINLPSSIISLGDDCFNECSSLIQIILPTSIISIGTGCFSRCKSLSQINIPSSISSLANECFFKCLSLPQIFLPSSVVSLGDDCFYDCIKLLQINISSSILSLGSRCFSGCTSLSPIIIPSSIISLPPGCFSGCEAVSQIDIPSLIISIDSHCFSRCRSLSQVNLPSSITSLPSGCFSGCESLLQINIPYPIISIYDKCFSHCISLVHIILPSSLVSIGAGCFSGCISLSEVDLPSSIESLGDECFSGCISLFQINLPLSITIGINCFKNCPIHYSF
jgi:hypothetical protein